jgi:hypothetical protein
VGKNKSPEHDLQVKIINHIRDVDPSIFFTATVGGVRLSINQAKRMKAAGYLRGIPDLLIFEPSGDYNGLAIELKAGKGKPSTHQLKALKSLRARGWRAEVSTGWDDTVELLSEYFPDLDFKHKKRAL